MSGDTVFVSESIVLRYTVNVNRIATKSADIFARKAQLPYIFTDSDENNKNPEININTRPTTIHL